MATRTAKLLPHLWHRPQDIIFVPAFILFGYYFAIMKVYALLTLHETGWGTRAGIGDPSAAMAAVEQQPEKLGAPMQTPYTDYMNDSSYNYPQQDAVSPAGYSQQTPYGHEQPRVYTTGEYTPTERTAPIHSQFASQTQQDQAYHAQAYEYRAYAQ